MRKVSELLASRPSKSNGIVACDTPLNEALQQLVFGGQSTLLVMDGASLIGVFTHAQLTLRLATGRSDFSGLTVRDVMSPDVAYATPDTDLVECMAMMTGYVTGLMPVLKQGNLVGFVEMREVIREALAEMQKKKPRAAASVTTARSSVRRPPLAPRWRPSPARFYL